jgi:Phage portal protein, SPP1 Gp6-like
MPGSPDLMEGIAALDREADRYAVLWRYYAGELPERFVSDRLKQLIEKSAKDYRFRLSRVPVETLANRVGINSIVSSSGDAVNAKIEEIRQANDMELQEPFIHERMFVYGDAYLMVWPIVEEDILDPSAPVDQDAVTAGVEFSYQSPLACRTMYDEEDGRHARFNIRRWKEKNPLGEVWRAEVWYADRVEPWITEPGSKGTSPEEWMPYAEDMFGDPVPAIQGQNWPEVHEFGEIPIKHARSDLPYGRSELEDFIGPQNIITKAIATQASGIESHGWRERYRIADDAALLEQASDIVPWGDDADARAATQDGLALTPLSGRRSGPGTEQVFHGTKAVGEFAPTDLGSFMEPIEQWIRIGAAASGTPLAEFDPRFGANMSGVAWDRAERPIRKKEADRKRFLLRFWREVYTLGLSLVGIADAGEITVNWSPPDVISDPDWWNTATVRRDHGVPQKTILLEANYTAEQIEEWEADGEDDAETLDRAIDRIARLGDAMQKLGAGSTLLGVPAERIATLVEAILGEAGSPGKLILEEKEDPAEEEDPESDNESGTGSGSVGG